MYKITKEGILYKKIELYENIELCEILLLTGGKLYGH